MDDLQLTIVAGFHVDRPAFDMTKRDAWFFALNQRLFGPHQLLVVTARPDGQIVGFAHCDLTEPPEMALKCCLATLDDGAAAAVAYGDEPAGFDSIPGLEKRFATARAAAREYGVHLVDWMLCDDTEILSMRFLLEEVDGVDAWWEVPPTDARERHSRDSNRRRRGSSSRTATPL
jgi:hypothetical protein